MNDQTFKIAIKNPCSNSWDEMDPVSVGRFCHSCQKNVIDFSKKTDTQIEKYVRAHQNEEICGRFYKSQVDTIRIEFDQHILHSDIKSWQKFLVILMICFGNDVLGIDFCLAQSNVQDSSFVQIHDTIETTMVLDSLISAVAEDTNSEVPLITVQNFKTDVYTEVIYTGVMISGAMAFIPVSNHLTETIHWIPPLLESHAEEVAVQKKVTHAKESSTTDYDTKFNPRPGNPKNAPLPDSNDNQNQNLYIFNESKTRRKRRKKRKA